VSNRHKFSGFNGPPPPASDALYAAKGSSATTSDLYTLDPATGIATSIGPTGYALTGLALRPSDGVLFGATSTQSASHPFSLITIDTTTGAGTLVGAFGFSSALGDIAFSSDDTLYGFRPDTRTLHTVNTSTGVATPVSGTPVVAPSAFGMGCSFDSSDIFYVFAKRGDVPFYIVDPSTGTPTTQTSLSSPYTLMVVAAASFDTNDALWAVINESGPIWHLSIIDVGTGVVTDVATIDNYFDALAWKGSAPPPPVLPDLFVYSKNITNGDTGDVYEQIWAAAWDASVPAFAVTTSTTDGDLDTDPHIRPDDFSQITFLRATGGGSRTLWVMDRDGSNQTQLDSNPCASPMFSPDGSKILYRQGSNIKTINPDGSGGATVITKSNVRRPTWSRDGGRIGYQVNNSNPTEDTLWVVNPDGSGDSQVATLGTGSLTGVGFAWATLADYLVYSKEIAGSVRRVNYTGTFDIELADSTVSYTTRACSYGGDDPESAFAVHFDAGDWKLTKFFNDGSGATDVSPTVLLNQLEGAGQPYVYGDRVCVVNDAFELYSIAPDGSGGRVDDTPRSGPTFFDEIHIQTIGQL
jgi:hypothetical protein